MSFRSRCLPAANGFIRELKDGNQEYGIVYLHGCEWCPSYPEYCVVSLLSLDSSSAQSQHSRDTSEPRSGLRGGLVSFLST